MFALDRRSLNLEASATLKFGFKQVTNNSGSRGL